MTTDHPQSSHVDAEYIVPLRWTNRQMDHGQDLIDYLRQLTQLITVTVVDGSESAVYNRLGQKLGRDMRHLPADGWHGLNGKVVGVMTGVLAAVHERIILADDDVFYSPEQIREMVHHLNGASVVRPQNVFRPLPWHARWDTGRSLLNRALGADYPGTLGIRRSQLLKAGGYDGDVLFENLELIRTLTVSGTEKRLPDLYVRRTPPDTGRFLAQRVRQAYDDFAQPGRLLAELAILPATVALLRRPRVLVAGCLAVVAVAEIGRRRHGGRKHYTAGAAVWALPWCAERAVCVWVALGARVRGGARYNGARLSVAAHSRANLAQRNRQPLLEESTAHE